MESLCARCSRLPDFGSCCIGTEIVITLRDIERISNKVKILDIYDLVPVSKHLEQIYCHPNNCTENDQLWVKYAFYSDGTRRILKHKEGRKCMFLTETGCSLDMETRPLCCRIFPFEFDDEGITGVCEDRCPVHLLEDKSLIEELDMDIEEAKRWHRQLFLELEEDFRNRVF